MAKSGTTTARATQMRSTSTSGVKHGSSNKNVQSHASPKGVTGSGMSKSRMTPIKGSDRGGL